MKSVKKARKDDPRFHREPTEEEWHESKEELDGFLDYSGDTFERDFDRFVKEMVRWSGL